MTESQIYRQLLEKLTMQSFLPESGPKLMEILQIIFSPEEAELALGLPFPVTDVEEIAQSLGRTVEEIVPTLERMADKGLVYAGVKEGRKRYQLLVLFPGMIELQFMGEQRIRPEPGRIKLARVFDEFYQDIMKGLTSEKKAKEFEHFFRSATPYSRVIPVESDIRLQSAIQPFEVVSNYIEDSKDMAIGNCYCRTIKGLLDQACEAPVDVCMVFGPFARYTVERGFARRADRSRMLETLHQAEEAGLVHVSDNVQDKINYICNCCGCCCGFLQAIARYRLPNSVAASRFFAVVDSETCTGCEACIDRCQTRAIRAEGEKVGIEEKWCIGCGLCVSACPVDAISLRERAEYRVPAQNVNELRMTIFREQFGSGE